MNIIKEQFPIFDDIIHEIYNHQAQAYLVGGVVRDIIMHKPIKDIDIEVHGVSLDELETILTTFGPVSLVGKSFGVLRLHGVNIDWSVPRTDSPGRKPMVTINPAMTIKQALQRRDLTMNAMAIDLKTQEIIDPFGGKKDIENKILRTPDKKLFIEDPLRFYRVMQFISRFEMFPDEKLNELCSHIDIKEVSRERIEQEFKKMLLLSKRPSLGIRWLKTVGRLQEVLPELYATITVPQEPRWHPEGTVFEHSMQALDAAADIAQTYDNDTKKLILLYAALCHDVGKVLTTTHDNGVIRSIGHEKEITYIKTMIRRITHDIELIEAVTSLILCHMTPLQLVQQHSSLSAYKRLANRLSRHVSMAQLADLVAADRRGRNGESDLPLPCAGLEVAIFIQNAQKADVFHKKEAPVLTGADLLEYVKAGPQMGQLLAKAYEIQINKGITDKEMLLKLIMRKK